MAVGFLFSFFLGGGGACFFVWRSSFWAFLRLELEKDVVQGSLEFPKSGSCGIDWCETIDPTLEVNPKGPPFLEIPTPKWNRSSKSAVGEPKEIVFAQPCRKPLSWINQGS